MNWENNSEKRGEQKYNVFFRYIYKRTIYNVHTYAIYFLYIEKLCRLLVCVCITKGFMENWIFLCCTVMADPKDDLYLYFYGNCLGLVANYIGLLKLISIFLLFFGSLIHYLLRKLTKITNISYVHNSSSLYTFYTSTNH